jgi:MFS family permease
MTTLAKPVPARAEARPPYSLYPPKQRWLLLAVLFCVSACNYMDRTIVSVLLEPIKKEFGVSDTLLGLLSGAAFSVVYASLGVPVARWADRGNRKLIIALAVAIWSMMTVLCGTVQSFVQLALARIGVGVGEAGALPPGQSLLVDYFPPHQRARALAIFTSAASAGYIAGFMLGAHIAATRGWRSAFVWVGAPGLLLAGLALVLLREPRKVLGPPAASSRESWTATLVLLWRKPAYRLTLLGLTLYSLFAYGALVFVPSYLLRVLGVGMAEMGTAYGSVSAVAALSGALAGGVLADRLAARDARWLLRLPAFGVALACPLYVAAFNSQDFTLFLILTGLGGVLLNGALPAGFAAAHLVCGSARRAMAVAILMFCVTMVASNAGPLLIGVVSDALAPRYGVAGLRYALSLMTLILFVSGWTLYRASRTLRDDAEQ